MHALAPFFDRRRPVARPVRRPDGSAAKRGLRYGVAATCMRRACDMYDRFANCDQRPIGRGENGKCALVLFWYLITRGCGCLEVTGYIRLR